MTDLEDDFADLDCIIAESEAKRAAARLLSSKHKRLASGKLSDDERLRITAEMRAYEDRYIWQTVAAVALFHTQECLGCGHKHRFFLGWMTQQDHKRDTHCRRFVRGRPIEQVAARIEEHSQPPVELCGDCAEAVLCVEAIVHSINESMHQQGAASAPTS